MNTEPAKALRLPSVDAVLRDAAVEGMLAAYGREGVTDAVRAALADARQAGRSADIADIAAEASGALADLMQPSLRPVFNLTGTVLHTNLGRAPMPEEAIRAMASAAGAANVEFDLDTGGRGERDSHVERWLTRLTGAEAALVVNNNAAAVMLALNTLAEGREVIVSRGELIEIGGAFRMPDIMTRSNCRLREVGTTNRTHLRDFENAIGPETGMLMKVHPSNYEVTGFTAMPAEKELAALAHARDLPFVDDLGSGALVDLARFGLPHERTPMQAIADGADLVTFSGDKLLGGPQAGLVVGRKELVDRLRRNPLKRAMRLDKIMLAALEAVLTLYADPDRLVERLPALRLLAREPASIKETAERVAAAFSNRLPDGLRVSVAEAMSQIGSGSLPVDRLHSWAVRLEPAGKKGSGAALKKLAAALRALPVPVIGRIEDDGLVLDMRCLEDEQAFAGQLEGLSLKGLPLQGPSGG